MDTKIESRRGRSEFGVINTNQFLRYLFLLQLLFLPLLRGLPLALQQRAQPGRLLQEPLILQHRNRNMYMHVWHLGKKIVRTIQLHVYM